MAEGHLLNIMNGAQERVTGAVTGITSDHANVHNGEGYSVQLFSTAILASAWLQLQFNTDATHYVHFKLYEKTAQNTLMRFSLLEATTASTFTPSTVAVIGYNRSRINNGDPSVKIFSQPTLVNSTLGFNILETGLIGSTGTQSAGGEGGNRSLDVEWVLKRNSTYIFRLDNIGGVTGQGGIFLFWYEEGLA